MGQVSTPAGRSVDDDAITWTATRSGGPGGQHANTSDTAVTVVIDVTRTGLPPHVVARVVGLVGPTITASSARSRSQWRNRQLATEAALSRLDVAAAPPAPPRTATRPTRASQERRLQSKQRASERKASRRRPTGDD